MTNHSQLHKCYDVQGIRKLEEHASQVVAINELMDRAGESVFEFIESKFSPCSILIFCGPGNNGGDGYVVARLAHARGYKVSVVYLSDPDDLPMPAKNAYKLCKNAGVRITNFDPLGSYDPNIIVDGLLGLGISRELDGDLLKAIRWINTQDVPTISIDIPSGINSDTGSVMPEAVNANYTITFIANKIGMLTNDAVDYVGELFVDSLNVDSDIFTRVDHVGEILRKEDINDCLSPRKKNSHKGDYGNVVIVGGAKGMAGAVMMAAKAAFRMAAGKVTIITDERHCGHITGYIPEAIVYPFDDSFSGYLADADAVVFGPGMADDGWSKIVWENFNYPGTTILDAGGLRLLAKYPKNFLNLILTPHAGEAASLLNLSNSSLVQKNRFKSARDIAKNYQATVILKGAGSIVCDEGSRYYISKYGNPSMATAGSGDILSGVIAGCLVSGCEMFSAAKIAVTIHALSGDMAAYGKPRGIMATDLIERITEVINI